MVLDSERVPLAAIAYQRGFDVDGLLLASCAELRSRGLHVGGVIQGSFGDPAYCSSQIHVVDLRSGEAFNIWEDRGSCSRGCRLDERGLIDAEPSIMKSLADGADLIVINRFGRAESVGRGLLGCLWPQLNLEYLLSRPCAHLMRRLGAHFMVVVRTLWFLRFRGSSIG